jgi:BNR repeat-containing family member
MSRWSRPIGVAVTVALLAVLLAIGLSSSPPEPGDLRNGQVFIQDNLWSTADYQYAVWVGGNSTPYAARRSRGSRRWKIVNLAKLPGNPLAAPTADDTHNVYVIATDAEGGVHVAGNMHDNPLRYVRAAPDLDGWARGPAPASDGSVTYPAFTALRDGTLLFWRRVGISGRGAVRLDYLPPGASAWHSLGVVLDGRQSGESPYLNHIAVDPRSGVIHLMFEWRRGGDVTTTNDVGYAQSRDGGRSWQASDGTPFRLPITHASAETVIDTPPAGSGLLNQGGMTVDARGRPHGMVVFDQPDGQRVWEEVWLDNGTWHRESFSDLNLDGRPQLAGTPDGRVWLLGARGATLEAIDVTPNRKRAPSQEVASVPVGWEANYDSQALARFGRVEMLIPEGDHPDRPRVVVARLPTS